MSEITQNVDTDNIHQDYRNQQCLQINSYC